MRARLQGLLFVGAAALYHLVMFGLYARSHGVSFEQTLAHFDSNQLADLVENGRGLITDGASEARWAFYPLVPAVVGAVGGSAYFVGAALSLLAFAGFALLPHQGFGDAPGRWGWFLLAFSPASLVLMTFHSEAVFLFASALCFYFLSGPRFVLSLFGLAVCVLTRNQGAFVAVIGLAVLAQSKRWGRVAAFAAVALAAEAVLLGQAAHASGTPWAYVRAQQHWPHATGVADVVRTLWMGNASQEVNRHWVPRHLYALAWLGVSVLMLRGQRAAGGYSLLSSAVMLLQGTLQNAFRFSSVVFPAFFFLGARLERQRLPVKLVVAFGWLALHHWVTLTWLRDGWPY